MHGYGGLSKALTSENFYVCMQVLDSGLRPSGLEVLQNVYGVTECTVYQVKEPTVTVSCVPEVRASVSTVKSDLNRSKLT